MGLFDFFKKTDVKVGKDSAVASSELGFDATKAATSQLVDTQLSLHPNWDVPLEQQYIFNFLANELQPLKPNQISLSAISIDEDSDTGEWHVKAFLRSSLPQPILLHDLELYILDSSQQRIAVQKFDFTALGEIPAESARPWVFTFDPASLETTAVPESGWELAFNLVSLRGHQLDLDPSWEKLIPLEQKQKLEEVVKTLPKLGPTEVNFMGFQIQMLDDGSLAAHVFVRNGHDRSINLEELPLAIIDANGLTVATGSFTFTPPMTIQANATKPWAFTFPKELVTEQNPDFSKWYARVNQN